MRAKVTPDCDKMRYWRQRQPINASRSMPEVAHPGEHHGEARRIGRRDHFLVADRAAGLDHHRCPGLGGGQQAIGEGEEGIGGDR